MIKIRKTVHTPNFKTHGRLCLRFSSSTVYEFNQNRYEIKMVSDGRNLLMQKKKKLILAYHRNSATLQKSIISHLSYHIRYYPTIVCFFRSHYAYFPQNRIYIF